MIRKNSFDIARHIAALAVIFSHHFAFNGLPEPKVLGVTKLGTFAVLVFFSISGYLIAGSYLNSSSLLSYYKKRIKRIFPALIVCSFIMIYIICPLFGTGSGLDYIFSLGALQSFIDYSALGWHPNNINGFASNYIHKGMLNGSLWTLSFEFAAYIFVSIAFFRKKNVSMSALIVIIISITTQLSVLNGIKIPHTGDLNRLSLLTTTFFVGSLLYCLRKYWESTHSKIILIILSTLCALFISEKNEYDLTFYIAVPLFIIPLCTLFKDKIINGKFDISYGMYIYAYPVQQIVVNELNLGFAASLILSLIFIMILAAMSWVFIEKRFICNNNLHKEHKKHIA